jgi:hypothetical protein
MHAALLEAEGSLMSLRAAVDVLVAPHGAKPSEAEDPAEQAVDTVCDGGQAKSYQQALAKDGRTGRIRCMHAAFQLVRRRAAVDASEGLELQKYFVGHLSPAARAALLLDAWKIRELLGVGPDSQGMLDWVASGWTEGASMAEAAPAVTCVLRHLTDMVDLSHVTRCGPTNKIACVSKVQERKSNHIE